MRHSWLLLVGALCLVYAAVVPPSSQTKAVGASGQAPTPIEKSAKVQEAVKRYLKEEGPIKRGSRFFDLAMLMSPTTYPWAPIPEKTVFKFLGKPDLVTELGIRNADGTWVDKSTSYVYFFKTKKGQKLAVYVTVKEGILRTIGWNARPVNDGSGSYRKYKK